MTAPFDLTREPWIPAERLDGASVELSTRDLLRDAHTLRGLADPSPLVIAALTRHLLAVLHRAYAGPRTMREWTAIASAGRFDRTRIDAYLDTVAARMDLFHPTHPFAQTRGLLAQFGDYIDPIDQLELTRSSWGLGRALFRHRPTDPLPTMGPARAARALLAHHAFATQGTVKKPGEPISASDAPLVGAGVVILRGDTLFETLISNLLRYDPVEGFPISTGGAMDVCSWEQSAPPSQLKVAKEPKESFLGYLDLLTRLSRRIELVCEGDVVTGFINAVWRGLPNAPPQDPMVTYRRDEKRGLLSVGINPARAFWRDAGALFEAGRGESRAYDRPKAIALVADPDALDVLGRGRRFSVEILGLSAEKSRVDAVRVERIHVAARSFNDATARTAVESSIAFAAKVADAIRSAVGVFAKKALSPGKRVPKTEDIKGLVTSIGAEEALWSALGVDFDGFMRDLADDPDAAAERFERRALATARDVFNRAVDRPDSSGRWLKARAIAEESLTSKLPRVHDRTAGMAAEEISP